MFLTRFSTRQDLAFLNPSCMLRQFICSLPGPPVSTSTFSILPFYVWVLSGVPCSSMQASCQFNLISSKLGQTIPELGEANPWKSMSSSLCLFSPGPYLIGVLQGGLWRDQSPLTWNPGLWSYYLPSSLSSVSQTPPTSCCCSQNCPDLHIPDQLFLTGK